MVERYFGRAVAHRTATYLEYQGPGWMHPDSNGRFAEHAGSSPGEPVCPVCGMPVSPETLLGLQHDGSTWQFCSRWCRAQFEAAPERFSGAVH
ncbi:YHS domain-containing protein [Actinoplanes sp. NBRC 103695]|uniref:YHS domain-containing protein n=1 Tax=Actinoplanes sp. NBRC 103695 TaxID=3032202 RepID=UPI0024A062B2|nr:hypothetical protein Acsp02_83810 [Actinoplanes sp. NBRC 103695]